jgi:uncharacterized protein YecE (DUF72 family)
VKGSRKVGGNEKEATCEINFRRSRESMAGVQSTDKIEFGSHLRTISLSKTFYIFQNPRALQSSM